MAGVVIFITCRLHKLVGSDVYGVKPECGRRSGDRVGQFLTTEVVGVGSRGAVGIADLAETVGGVVLVLREFAASVKHRLLVAVSVVRVDRLVVELIGHRSRAAKGVILKATDSARVCLTRDPTELIVGISGSTAERVDPRDDVAKRVVGETRDFAVRIRERSCIAAFVPRHRELRAELVCNTCQVVVGVVRQRASLVQLISRRGG